MDLDDLVNRLRSPLPWTEADNIPWYEPEFSRRMLVEHLSQAHDAASRRLKIINKHVEWIHTALLSGQRKRVLDLGCGPGLYTERLARLGHTCFGIDYSPASIEYAVATAKRDRLDCIYNCQDFRLAEFPGNVDLVQLIYGEFNIFRPADVAKILDKSWQTLKPGGALLLEPHTYPMVKKLGKQPPTWYSSSGGLYFDGQHLVLKENFWDEGSHTTTIRYYVIQARTGKVSRYAQSFQAYSDSEYRKLLIEHGFKEIEFRRGLSDRYPQKGLLVIVARK